MTNAQAAPASPAPALSLLVPAAERNLRAALKRFQTSVQDVLDAPLDVARVVEWATLRTAAER